MKNYPDAYIDYLIEFHGTRDYFECHEIMEEYWKEVGGGDQWLGLIQLAVAVYHERQKNRKGSLRLYHHCLKHIENNRSSFKNISINPDLLLKKVQDRIQTVNDDGPYLPFNIPLTEDHLIEHCKDLCKKENLSWCGFEDLSNSDLVFRHKLRDRSDVIKERKASLERKRKAREE
ncbi:DUF309 domain-containing protein [Evansella halocellulosilytica]|uniref:DUF309 domain-containing protein n=1 Tax=Evansella halocellulosilytica TaxID=2011013 RepID=UPI000BB8CE01|nr:DUF309 domain-containing protein [Evansella halocellulosilytica]